MARKTKAETVAENLEAFLSGRSEAARQEFLSKELGKQYNSIMQWKRRQGEKENIGQHSSGNDANDILLGVRGMIRKIENNPNVGDKDIAKIRTEVEKLHDLLVNYNKIQIRFAIKEREQKILEMHQQEDRIRIQREAMERDLAELKSGENN